ncbi:Tex-like N-terminal domain-containing protein [Prevotella fusca]
MDKHHTAKKTSIRTIANTQQIRLLPPSGEPEGAVGASFISHSLSLPLQSVSAILTLLYEGCTIPFISRYRKKRTGNLDEVQASGKSPAKNDKNLQD